MHDQFSENARTQGRILKRLTAFVDANTLNINGYFDLGKISVEKNVLPFLLNPR